MDGSFRLKFEGTGIEKNTSLPKSLVVKLQACWFCGAAFCDVASRHYSYLRIWRGKDSKSRLQHSVRFGLPELKFQAWRFKVRAP